jgi:hypothetical protein
MKKRLSKFKFELALKTQFAQNHELAKPRKKIFLNVGKPIQLIIRYLSIFNNQNIWDVDDL